MTTAVLGPFETGKTLLQVQYLPHEDIEVVAPFDPAHPNPIQEVAAEMILKHIVIFPRLIIATYFSLL